MVAIVRAPIGHFASLVFQLVQVAAEILAPRATLLLYLIRVFAHWRFSLTVETVF